MTEGEYTFRFTVTDNDGGTSQDELKIYVTPLKVNQSPTADAGDDIIIYLPENSVKISGGGNDVDGEIVAYLWEKVSGPAITIAAADKPGLDLSNLVEGVYEFKLTVTDNEAATGSDNVMVFVHPEETNLPPTVDLGNNIIVKLPLDSLVISGTANDPDGVISKYTWLKISGANVTLLPNNETLVLKNLKEGTYIFRLTVQDDDGATAYDDIIITINQASANNNPVSNAGSDVFVTLPQDTLTIFGQGSDPDGDVITFNWSQISGPSVVALEGIDNAELHLSKLVEGTYVFELVVTDAKGATASDRVRLVVNPVPPDNIPPVADAGKDISITFPVNNYIHVGKGSDEDGLIISYEWRMVSGPMANNFVTYSDTLVLHGLASGTYIYELLVMDSDSAVATDEIQVRVGAGDLSGLGAHKIFSPDGNGIDDYWEIDNLELISGCQLTIFNRFGLQVFESNNYNNDWGGTYNGKSLPEGDYYFVIRCGDGSNTATGGIRIIRDY
jgi:gliding motility-associated-like protein